MPKDLEKMLAEMKDAQGMIGFWLKGSPINSMLLEWIETTTKYINILNLYTVEKEKRNVENKV